MDSGLFLLIKGIGVCFPNLRNLRLKFSQFKEVRDSNFHNLKKVCNSFFHNDDLWATQFWTVFDTCFQKSCTARNSFVHSFQQWIFLWTVRDSICSQFWTVCNSFFKIVNSARLIFPPCWINSARLLFFQILNSARLIFTNFEQCATHVFSQFEEFLTYFFVILNEQCPTKLSPIFEQCANDCSKFCTARDMIFSQFWTVRNSFFHNFEWTVHDLFFCKNLNSEQLILQILYSAWLIFSKFNLWKVWDSFFHNFEIIMNSGLLMFPTIFNSARLIFSNFGTVRVSFFHNFEQCATHFSTILNKQFATVEQLALIIGSSAWEWV